ncbi:MAG: hypothetical protein JNM09_08860 [Blastocatellia bacterium]|nr:hypothetical protein [Blastocatellia bacterium]
MTSREREVPPKSAQGFVRLLIGSPGQIPATVTLCGGVLREARNDWLRQRSVALTLFTKG